MATCGRGSTSPSTKENATKKRVTQQIRTPRKPQHPKPAKPTTEGNSKFKKIQTPPAKPKRFSALNVAAIVLGAAKKPMRAGEMIAAMETKNLWKSPVGKTPSATLYASIVREIKAMGSASRFKQIERGLFTAPGG